MGHGESELGDFEKEVKLLWRLCGLRWCRGARPSPIFVAIEHAAGLPICQWDVAERAVDPYLAFWGILEGPEECLEES